MAKSSAPQAKLAEIDWKGNNSLLISALLTELEKPENSKIFIGKADKKEVCLILASRGFFSLQSSEHQWRQQGEGL